MASPRTACEDPCVVELAFVSLTHCARVADKTTWRTIDDKRKKRLTTVTERISQTLRKHDLDEVRHTKGSNAQRIHELLQRRC